MASGINLVQYLLPEESTVAFDVLDSNASIQALQGTTKVQDELLPVGSRLSLKLGSRARLRTEEKSAFVIHGNHAVLSAFKSSAQSALCMFLFQLLPSDKGYRFIIDRGVRLHIFFDKVEDVDDRSNDGEYVCIKALEGKAQIFGSILRLNEEYYLPPNSDALVYTRDPRFILYIEGKNRVVQIAATPLMKDTYWGQIEEVHAYLQALRKTHSKTRSMGPIVLVTGPRKVGRTSFCHFLVNKAVEDGSCPLYIDLDVYYNSNSVPGTLSMVAVEGLRHITDGFPGNTEVLHFGSIDPLDNIRLYFLLVREMGTLFNERIKSPSHRSAGAVIDMCGSLATEIDAVRCVIDSFEIGYLYIMSDENRFRNMCHSIQEDNSSLPINLILQNEAYHRETNSKVEMMIRRSRFKQYFVGLVRRPRLFFHVTMKLSDVKILTTDYDQAGDRSIIYLADDIIMNIGISVVEFKNDILDNVLGVSEADVAHEGILLTKILYFVTVLDINHDSETIMFASPKAEGLGGRILLMGKNEF